MFALYACGDCFDAEQKARDFDYYERITVRDSSLSASIQAIVAAEVGQLELAYDYFGETAFIDLRDLAFNTEDGIHLASLAGTWLVAVAGFGGMRDHGDTLAFAPRLPSRLARLAFRLLYRGRRLRVEIHPHHASYELLDGEPLELLHHGERFTLGPGAPDTRPLPELHEGARGPSRRRGASRRGATRRPRLRRHGRGRAAAGGRARGVGARTCSAAPGSRRRRRPPWPTRWSTPACAASTRTASPACPIYVERLRGGRPQPAAAAADRARARRRSR